MDKSTTAALVLLFLVLVLGLMALSWRMRARRQRSLPMTVGVPTDLGAPIGAFEALYVATTVSGDRLNRIAVRGLGFRAKTTVEVFSSGIVIQVAGQSDVFIPVEDILRVTTATWTIDRAVEDNGLIELTWLLGDTALDSYFRCARQAEMLSAIDGLLRLTTESDTQ